MSKGPHGSHDMGKHVLLMLLCCLAPIAVIGVVWFTGVKSSTLNSLIPLLCPLLMLLCIGMMLKDHYFAKKAPDGSAQPVEAGQDEHHDHSRK